MERLALERKNLVNNVKKLDEAMLALRAVAGTSPAVAQRFPSVLQSLAGVRKSVGLDGPQQLLDYTAPPVDLRALAASTPATAGPVAAAPAAAAAPVAGRRRRAGRRWAEPGRGRGRAGQPCPSPSAAIAAMLPLSDLPPGWTVGKSGEQHLETFNAENLYEKIDGRAESFLQYGVKGMAYTFYHPTGDASNELQLYIFEMADSAQGPGQVRLGEARRGPSRSRSATRGTPRPAARSSTRASTTPRSSRPQDDPKFAAFALELARRVAARQKPGAATAPVDAAAAAVRPRRADRADGRKPKPAAAAKPAAAEVTPRRSSPSCRPRAGEGEPKYVAQDVFGYSFLSDVFMADYKDGDVTWQGFLRPYRDAEEAKAVFEKYLDGVKKDGAEVKTIDGRGGRRDGRQHQHRPGRRRLPQGEHRGRGQRRHRRPPGRELSPARWPRACRPASRRSGAASEP